MLIVPIATDSIPPSGFQGDMQSSTPTQEVLTTLRETCDSGEGQRAKTGTIQSKR